MTRILALLLLVQLVIAGALYWPVAQDSEAPASLIRNITADTVQRLEIAGKDGSSNTITRAGDAWTLASGLPADDIKVQTLLAGLLTTDPGFAVATSEAAAKRFKVAEEAFERRIRIAATDSDRTVYLGSAPSFRKIHARRDGEAAVYMIDLNTYDAPTEDDAWLDRSLLRVEAAREIELYGLRFTLGDAGWSRDDGKAVDPAAMEQLVQALETLRVSGLVGEDDEDALAAGETLRITAKGAQGEIRLTVLDNPDIERYYLRSDAYEPRFNTSAFDAERLIEAAKSAAGIAGIEAGGEEIEIEGDEAAL